MRKIYIDSDYKCHVTDDGTMTPVETDFFDGKCDDFIEGYRFVLGGEFWEREDGEIFCGEMIVPWMDYSELDKAQREYERELLKQYENEIAELDATLLEMQYQNLMEDL